MPLIGISGSIELKENKVFLLQAYFDAVSEAGGIPVLLDPRMKDQALVRCMSALDGLLLAGGGDVEPWRYGQEPIEAIGEMTPVRDSLELRLLAKAAERQSMPVFGICRGLQVMNIAAGGTLYQDLETQHPRKQQDLLAHKQSRPYEEPSHSVAILRDSVLYKLCTRENAMVNSMHHQAIDRLAPDYRATAISPDGVIEAIEHLRHPGWFAVQWHPERLDDPLSKGVFAEFVRNAAQHRREKG